MAYSAKPTFFPRFAINDVTDGGGRVNVTEPPTDKKNNGWEYLEKPARDYMNWIHRGNYLWIDYFNQFWNSSHQFLINEITSESGNGVDILEPLGIKTVPASGTNLQIHQVDSAASVQRFTNLTTTSAASHGFEVGIDASEQGRIWNYENTDLVIGTNNTAYLTLDNAGVITPAVPFSTINIQSATTPQVRIAYDGTYYKTLTITSAGFMGFNVTTPYTDFQFNGKLRIATANNSGILSLGESGATVINVGIWRGLSNSLTGGNVLNLGGYGGIQLAVGSAEIGSQTSAMTIGNTGIVSLLNTTECTGAGTGALQVSGGADFAKHIRAGLGRIPAGFIEDTSVQANAIFDALSPFIPNPTDSIILTGGMAFSTTAVLYIVTRAVRVNSTVIHIHAVAIDYAGASVFTSAISIIDGNATLFDLAIAW